MITSTEFHIAREQLKEHIEAIIDDNLGLIEYKDDIIKQLHNAIDIHLPAHD